MDFELSEEQRLLKDSVERLCTQRYEFETRKKYMKEADGWSRDMWRQYVDLGLTALPFAEEHGGVGGGPVETMIVMEAFGRALALEPYFATVVIGGGFLRRGASDAVKTDVLPKVAAGEALLSFAHIERQARYDLADVATTAKKDSAGYVLNGEKSLAVHGDVADRLIVSARISGEQRAKNGIGLFLVDAKADGVSRRGYPTMDGLRAAEVTLQNVKVDADAVIGEPSNAYPLIEQVVDSGIAALAAEAVGAMSAMHEITVDYLKQRK
ncbi:MAG TPA: acyl-CoA dehydrogenase family protein, partial [Burkholderiales bacterium]|nr:acyl-CoA dehydrogenase family protein [Burkholderiales bacterium]